MEEHWIPATPLRRCMQFCPDCLLSSLYRVGKVAHETAGMEKPLSMLGRLNSVAALEFPTFLSVTPHPCSARKPDSLLCFPRVVCVRIVLCH